MSATTEYPAHRFSLSTGDWERVDQQEAVAAAAVAAAEAPVTGNRQLRFVTYNVWFGSYHMVERFHGLMGIVKQQDPDFICFQEVTERFLSLLRAEPWVRERYCIFDPRGNSFRYAIHYGVTMLARATPVGGMFRLLALPTEMGRRLLEARFAVDGGEELTVATVHLESLDSVARRAEQLQAIGAHLSDRKHAALMGDFNLCGSWAHENVHVEALGMQDAWPTLHGADGEKGWTEDNSINRMLPLVHSNNPGGRRDMPLRQVRFDRVLLRSDAWKLASIQLLGTTPLSDSADEPVWPSDHFGLCCTVVHQ